jgi:hypothetical protein
MYEVILKRLSVVITIMSVSLMLIVALLVKGSVRATRGGVNRR